MLNCALSHRFQFWVNDWAKVKNEKILRKFKNEFIEAKNVFKLIREMSDVEIEKLQQTGSTTLGAHSITADEVILSFIWFIDN